ncbi:MAG: phenylalanine--tRNA ligase subunit alpha [Actinobacteria bacterium]|nr:MAG: phenylalanine--tRNA ligase subunit alpha [Actinomycetota bacterium]
MAAVDEVGRILAEGTEAVERASDLGALEAVRVEFLGKKGRLTGVLKQLGSLPEEERPSVGKAANEARLALEEALRRRRVELESASIEAKISAEAVDISLPGKRHRAGRPHLLTQIMDEIVDIFVGLGYLVAEGPEVELDYYNFTALNHPPDHPARSLQDTLFVREPARQAGAPHEVLLRTHTSPMQIRVMEKTEPPLFYVVPGRTYRRDVPDPSHTPVFHQVEGFAVAEDITFGDLKGTLEVFVHEMFGPDRKVRLRPHYFPFTEPSAEVDVSCSICAGAGCRMCGETGWLEILGCGMIDPNVYGFVGYDKERYTGFAFGMGVERIAALRHDISDIRYLYENDMRFLRQF